LSEEIKEMWRFIAFKYCNTLSHLFVNYLELFFFVAGGRRYYFYKYKEKFVILQSIGII